MPPQEQGPWTDYQAKAPTTPSATTEAGPWQDYAQTAPQPTAPIQAPAIGVSAQPIAPPTMQERIGAHIPDVAMPVLSTAQKYLVAPFEHMAQWGADVGGQAARYPSELLTATEQLPQTLRGVSPYGPVPAQTAPLEEATRQAHPITTGAASAVGELAGGMAADPRMWALSLGSVGSAAVRRLISGGFSAQQIYGAATTAPEVNEAIKRGDWYEASRLITHTTASALMGLGAGAHFLFGKETPTSPKESKPVSIPATNEPKVFPTPRPAGLATGGTIGMDRLDPKDLVAPAAKATTVDHQKMADARANAPTTVTATSMDIAGAIADLTENRHPDIVSMGIKLPGGSTLGEMAKFLSVEKNADGNYRIANTPQNQMMKQQLIGLLRQLQTPEDANIAAATAPEMPKEGLTHEQAETVQAALVRDQTKREAIAATTGKLPTNPFDEKLNAAGLHQVIPGAMPTSDGLIHFEHPGHPTLSMGLEAGKVLDMTPDQLRTYAADKFESDAAKYEREPMSPFLNKFGQFDPANLRATAAKLRGEITDKPEPISPEVKSKADVSPVPQDSTAPPVPADRQPVPAKVEGMRPEETSLPANVLVNHIQTVEALASQQLSYAGTEVADVAKGRLNTLIATLGEKLNLPNLTAVAGVLKDRSERLKTQANAILAGNEAHEKNMPLREATMGVKRARYTAGEVHIPGEEDMGALEAGTEPEFKGLARDRMARSTGKTQVPGRTLEDFIPFDAPEGMERSSMSHEEQEQFDTFQQGELVKLKKLDAEIGRDFQIASSTQSAEHFYDVIYPKLKELDSLGDQLGRFAKTEEVYKQGARPDIEPTAGPSGEINIHEGFVWTKKAADLALNKNNRTIPTIEDFANEAKTRNDKAKIFDDASQRLAVLADRKSNLLQKQLSGSESGVAGPLRPYPSIQASLQGGHAGGGVASLEELGREGRFVKISRSGMPTDQGKVPDFNLGPGEAGYRVRPDGRRELVSGFETPATERGIENYTKEVFGKRLPQRGGGGLEVMGRAAAISGGALAGAKVGAPYGITGVIGGGTVGAFIGAVSPDLLGRPAFKFAANTMLPFLRESGTSLKDFFKGPNIHAGVDLPDMREILEEQYHAADGNTPKFSERLRQFPGNIYQKTLEPFLFISDNPSHVQRWMLQLLGDQRGSAFRDASGRIKTDDSPYVSARRAVGMTNGHISEIRVGCKSILEDAYNYGTEGHIANLRRYLNLKNYERVLEVKQEDITEHQQNIQSWQNKLQSANITPLQEAALHSDIGKASKELIDLQKKMASGAFNPKGFNADKIANNLQQLEQQMGPADFEHMKGLADRYWGQIRQVTDDLHKFEVMTDSAYQKFTSRTNEYAPMYRIMTDLAENAKNRMTGSKYPLYLMHDDVIKTLEGSERTNQDPFVVLGKFATASYREIFRNKVIQDYLQAGKAEPAIGEYFKEVSTDTRARQGFSIVGTYEKGIQKRYEVPSYLAEALESSPIAARSALTGMLGFTAKYFKAGATGLNLAFTLPLAFTHVIRAGIESEAPLVPFVKAWLQSLHQSLEDDPSYREMMRNGAGWGIMQRLITPEYFLDFNNLGWKKRTGSGRILDYVIDLNVALEDRCKLATYKSLRASGYSEKAASWETMRYGGAPDFSHQGAWMPEANVMFMFFNAHLAYLRQDLQRLAENPKKMVVALGAVTAMQMTLAQWNWSRKDEKGEYLMRGIRPFDRDNYWICLSGEKTRDPATGGLVPEVLFRIRKPSPVKFFVNPIENMINKVAHREDQTGTEIALRAVSSWMPGQYQIEPKHPIKDVATGLIASANPALRVPAELALNRTAIGPIVPQREQGIESQYQIGPGTSATAQAIGQGGLKGAAAGGLWGGTFGEFIGGHPGALVGGAIGATAGAIGVSPRQADYVLKGIGGGLSQEATTVTDPFFGGINQARRHQGIAKVKDVPFAGPILGRFVTPGGSYEQEKASKDFYDGMQQAQQQKATFDLLIKQDPQKAYQYQRQSGDLMFKLGVATEISQRVAALRQIQEQVQSSKDLTEDQRNEYLQRIFQARLSMLQAGTRIWKPAASPSPSNSRGTGNAER